MHFFGFNFHWNVLRAAKVRPKLSMSFLGFDNYIINVSLDEVIFYLVFEAGLYGALVGSPGVLEPE